EWSRSRARWIDAEDTFGDQEYEISSLYPPASRLCCPRRAERPDVSSVRQPQHAAVRAVARCHDKWDNSAVLDPVLTRDRLMKKKTPTTAAEFLASLHADPAWVAQNEARNRKLAEQIDAHRRDEAPLVSELHKAGVNVQSAWDLVNT